MLRRVVIATAALAAVVAFSPLPAAAGIFGDGDTFGWARPYLMDLLDTAIAALLAYIAWKARTKWNVDIDAGMRDAIKTWVMNQASSLVADGKVKVVGNTVDVRDTKALSIAVDSAKKLIPEAKKRFNLSEQDLAAKVIDALPQVPAVAAALGETLKALPQVPHPVDIKPHNRT